VNHTTYLPIEQIPRVTPNPSNTGVTGIRTFGHLDYLAVTFPANKPFSALLPPEIKPDFELTGRGRYGYRRAYQNTLGALLMADGDERQGMHVVLSGKPMETLRDRGITDRAMCQHILKEGGQVARLDVAIDIHAGKLRPADLERAYLAKEVKTVARSAERHYGINKGEAADTLYLGSRTSDRYLRFYAKESEGEMGNKAVYMRLELELKKLRAQGVNAVISASDDTRAVINRAIHDYVTWDGSEEFTAVLAGHDVDLPSLPRGDTNWEAWMKTQVIPSMVRMQLTYPETNVTEWFLENFAAQLEVAYATGTKRQ
jgi:hypothetical protein